MTLFEDIGKDQNIIKIKLDDEEKKKLFDEDGRVGGLIKIDKEYIGIIEVLEAEDNIYTVVVVRGVDYPKVLKMMKEKRIGKK